MRVLLIASLIFFISGCAGLDIRPISKKQADQVHNIDNSMEGYIVYQPMVLVEVINKEICTNQKDGDCISVGNICGYGQVIYLPDYSKPYLVDSSNGFGKAGVDIQIKDGWMLAGLKDTSDNTALLNKILPDVSTSKKSDTDTCEKPGLYILDKDKMTLEEWKLW